MSKQQQQITTPPDSKYFHRMLNMADDDLGPYEYRLLGHYIRVGDCWEGVRKTAKITRMSVGKVVSTRNELEKAGYIHVEHREQDTCLVTVIDRMAENVARYSKAFMERTPRSYGEQGVHMVNTSELEGVHVVNERRTRTKEEEPIKEKEITTSAPIVAESVPPTQWPADQEVSFSLSGKTEIPAPAENLEMGNADKETTTPTPQPPSRSRSGKAATGKRTDKQLANDARIEALRVAMYKGRGKADIPLEGKEISNYASVAKQLIDGGIAQDDFLAYVEYWNKAAQTWPGGLTLNSLVKAGRMTDFKSWYAEEAENKRKQKELEERIYAKYPHARPSTESVEYSAEDVQRMMDLMLKPTTRQENAS